jgi:iron complex transport system ATP-binding protein
LLKTICGIQPVSKGQILLDGQGLLTLPRNLLAQKTAYLAQNRQIPDITVERLILHGRFPYLGYPRRYRSEDYIAARNAMEQMQIADLADIPLQHLSGGQRQKVYIAMVLAQNTPVVLMDEPTTYLDIRHQLQLMQQACAMAGEGKTVIMVLHDLLHAFQCADRIILMQDGRVVASDTPERLYASGAVEKVFQIRLGRIMTQTGWRYYCDEDRV